MKYTMNDMKMAVLVSFSHAFLEAFHNLEYNVVSE